MSDTPTELPVAVARWLVTGDGRAAIERCEASVRGGSDRLSVISALRGDGLDRDRAAAVVAAADARTRARLRWPDADRLVFTRAGLEQASDPAVSAWRAARLADDGPVEDRAAGCGGDSLALAAAGAAVAASDLDASRLVLLAHNAAVRDLEVATTVADALAHPPPRSGPVHVDPARRVGERRVRRLEDHRPSVPALFAHLATVASGPGLAVVLGPGVDPDDPALPPEAEIEFVQLGRQLVEAVVWTGNLRRTAPGAAAPPRRTATILPAPDDLDGVPVTRSRGERGPRLPVGPIGDVLVEVAPAAVRARLHDQLGADIGARRIAQRRALLTADTVVPDSPWWQVRRVETVLPVSARAVRRWLRTADPRPVEVVLHGVDVDPEAYRRALGSPPRGPDGYRVELVRDDEGARAVLTSRARTVT